MEGAEPVDAGEARSDMEDVGPGGAAAAAVDMAAGIQPLFLSLLPIKV